MFRRFPGAAAVLTLLPVIAVANTGLIQVTSVRSWSHAGSTRVILETTGKFEFRSDSASKPDRLFFDVLRARPWIAQRRYATRVVNDALVRRVRVAETNPGITRIVFDLTGPVNYKVTRLDTPDRMVIEIRPLSRETAPGSLTRDHAPGFIYPPVRQTRTQRVMMASGAPLLDPVPLRTVYLPESALRISPLRPTVRQSVSALAVIAPRPAPYEPVPPPVVIHEMPGHDLPAHVSENASRSLTRALGLKVNRIVIDAGHGGHDDGTIGPNGVLEKDVVLDVALRVAKLVQSHMGIEVILTRPDDTFIPLHERTAIANERGADLFLSIHANSSPSPVVAGTETFFLNFTNSAAALDVAARENAGAEKSVGELKDLIQSITLNEKITESQTFAQTVQNAIFTQASKSNIAARNRGVKRAPFVVLIGASMPSILAEIGFLSNARDEANLSKPEYRQKIAEALYKGLAQYSQSLSHFEMANGTDKSEKLAGAGLN